MVPSTGTVASIGISTGAGTENQCQYGDWHRCRLGNSRQAGTGTGTEASTGNCTGTGFGTGTGTGVVTYTKLYYRVFPLENVPRRFQIGKYCQY